MAPLREPPMTILPSAWVTMGKRFSTFENNVPSACDPTWKPVPLNCRSGSPSASAAAGMTRLPRVTARAVANVRHLRRRFFEWDTHRSWSRI